MMRRPRKLPETGAFLDLKRRINELVEFSVASRLITVKGGKLAETSNGTALEIDQAAAEATPSPVTCAVIRSLPSTGIMTVRDLSHRNWPPSQTYTVAAPLAFRRYSWDGKTIDSNWTITYSDWNDRTIKRTDSPTAYIRQFIWPPYITENILSGPAHNPLEGSIIYVAKPNGGTGVWVDASDNIVDVDDPSADHEIEYIDINAEGRHWMSELNLYRVCQNNSLFDVVFAAGPKASP